MAGYPYTSAGRLAVISVAVPLLAFVLYRSNNGDWYVTAIYPYSEFTSFISLVLAFIRPARQFWWLSRV